MPWILKPYCVLDFLDEHDLPEAKSLSERANSLLTIKEKNVEYGWHAFISEAIAELCMQANCCARGQTQDGLSSVHR